MALEWQHTVKRSRDPISGRTSLRKTISDLEQDALKVESLERELDFKDEMLELKDKEIARLTTTLATFQALFQRRDLVPPPTQLTPGTEEEKSNGEEKPGK